MRDAKATPTAEPKEAAPKANVHPSTLKASENGTDIMEYAKRVLESQSPDLAMTFQMASVEKALLNQGWDFSEVRKVVEDLYKEINAQ